MQNINPQTMKKTVVCQAILLLFVFCGAFSKLYAADITGLIISADKTVLNPVLRPGEVAILTATAIMDNGTTKTINNTAVTYQSTTKVASGNVEVAAINGNNVLPKNGGICTITAVYVNGDKTFTATIDIIVRPYYREYHQTLVLKLMMGMEGEPVERLKNEPMFTKPHDVLCTFEQALEVIKKTDNLTAGIPKILYLVGWQKGGHDHEYPSWATVNPKLKRAQDSTALQSLRWLIVAARKYNTTVSLHINMVDAYRHSPLWDEYAAKDIFAKDTSGKLLVSGIAIKGDSMYHISYTREWQAGLAQKRIDALIKMIPELLDGHTIHVDVFVAKGEFEETISPWHAKPENGGIDIYKEVETQRKIFNYWRTKGFDVTGEGIFWAHPPGEGFQGLQPMSWWYPDDINYQMQVPEMLSARGRTSRSDDGDFRFTSSMQGEEIFNNDKENLPGFMQMFCRTTLPWQYLSKLQRLALINDTLFYSGGVKAAVENGHNIIRKGNFILRDNDDLFVPALWKQKEIIAYSQNGYKNRQWVLPKDWSKVLKVDLYEVTINGTKLLEKSKLILQGKLELSLSKETAVCIVPAGSIE